MSRPVLVYQGTCRFCCVVTGLILLWDRERRLRPVALETQEAAELLASVPPDVRTRSWHLVNTGGALFSAGFAFPELLRVLPGGRRLSAVSGARPALTQRAYLGVASRRSAIGRVLPDAVVRRARAVIAERSA